MKEKADALGVGIIGLGHMGRKHLLAWKAVEAGGLPCRLSAVTNRHKDSMLDAVSESLMGVCVVKHAHELISRPEVSVVSICTPTNTHVDLTIAALRAGKHVMVEKPVALHSSEIRRLMHEAERTNALCMPAHCMRFWPGWDWLQSRVQDESFGKVRSAVFQRLSSRPQRSSFYQDNACTGGALVDLHIHDADFLRWIFGDPVEVMSIGSIDHVTTLYCYENGPEHVVAEGAWNHSPGFPFRMRYVVVFDEATVDFDLGRTPQLLCVHHGRAEPVELSQTSAYEAQVRHFVATITDESCRLRVTLEDALDVARMLEAERESLESGRAVSLRKR